MKFLYRMELDFDAPVHEHHFTMKCLPRSSCRQIISDLRFAIDPDVRVWRGRDGFGNIKLMGYLKQPHDHIQVCVSGRALVDGVMDREKSQFFPYGCMKYASALTKAGPAIRAIHQKTREKAEKAESGLHFYRRKPELIFAAAAMEAVHEALAYIPGSTGVCTSAEQAARAGRGVCQDFAQVMLAVLRMEAIPCRYVCGILAGEGESHAWVEVFSDGAWTGFDPTNLIPADERHLVISYGRDARDCRINQGVFLGLDNGIVCQRQNIICKTIQYGDYYDKNDSISRISC